METKFKVGDSVWVAKCSNTQAHVTCPICYGKRRVTLILGNDDTVSLECGYCGRGYEGPRGYVEEFQYKAEPQLIQITGMSINQSNTETVVEYHLGSAHSYRVLREENLFDTLEEAAKRSLELKAQYENEQRTKQKYLKKNLNKSYAWNAGYHLREAKRHRGDAEYHDKKAVLCKAKSKEGGDKDV